jgi:hypothetical protein
VFTRPSSLSDAVIADAVADRWGREVDRVEYAPVGFGSHHWLVGTAGGWEVFVTVDDLAAKVDVPGEPLELPYERLDAAFTTSRRLADIGCAFVVAPMRDRDGHVLHRLDAGYTIACFAFIDGEVGEHGAYRSEQDRTTVARHLVTLHRLDRALVGSCRIEDFVLANRDELVAALGQVDEPWDSGPFAASAGNLLRSNAGDVARLLDRHDELVAAARASQHDWAITHGEPHGANALTTSQGLVLIDWDTVLVAPRERDVWHLDPDDTAAAGLYLAVGGAPLDESLLELYRIQWDLSEIAGYTTLLRGPHEDTDDVRESFANLVHFLERRRP